MNKIAYAIGTIAIMGLSYIGLKALVATVAQTTVDAVVALFTAPIKGRPVDRV